MHSSPAFIGINHQFDYIHITDFRNYITGPGRIIPKSDNILHRIRYEKSAMTKSETKALISELHELMNKKKLYLDCQLNLKTLADALKTNTHRLSQSLNEYQGENFFDFVNRYRIEEVKKNLADPDSEKFKIIAIAYDCGFNSRSAFYNSFKKFTGQTPSGYLNSLSHV